MRTDAAELVDPLARLPDPPDDVQAFRTFPGAPSHGRITWTANADGSLSFTAELPRRYGTIGATRHGLFASGGWYPQPAGLPLATWDVTVRLPGGTTGALGDVLGEGVVRWTGEGERAGLAVVRRGVISAVDARGSDVHLLTRGRPRRALLRELGDGLALLPRRVRGSAVEAPLRRRLTGHSPGLAYVSDRAFRVSAGFAFVHREAVARGVAAAFVERPDPFERELAAAAYGEIVDARLRGLEADRLLGVFRWVPQVNALLSSQRLAFYSEILDRTWPGDPVLDDLAEVTAAYTPGTVVLAQLDDRFGPGTGVRVGLGLADGEPPEDALADAGVEAGFLGPWRTRPPPEDYVLTVRAGEVLVSRDAPAHAPPEIVVLAADDRRLPLDLPPGLHEIAFDELPERLVLDPDLDVEQRSRSGDSWPPRYDVTAAGWIDTVNLTQQQLYLGGQVTLRRQYDTRNLWFGTLSNGRSDLVGAAVGYLRKEGRLLDAWTRPHRVRADAEVSVLNPGFSDTDGLAVALDGALSYAYDDRVSGEFPLRGKRVGLGWGGGGIPGSDDTWISASAHAVGVASFHPRHAVAGRTTAAVAQSSLPHRLLTLGGEGAMRSIPALPACPAEGEPCLPVATSRGVAMFEYRWAPIRGWSVPLLFGWGTELQLAGGVEGLVARVDGELAWAAGATAGILGVGDVLGAETSAIGLTAGWPLAFDGVDRLETSAVPELYLKFGQAF